MKYGTRIDADAMKAAGLEPDIRELSKEAYRSMSVAGADGASPDESCIKRVNGMKDEYGSGVSTLITIYNALGCSLRYRTAHDSSGHIWKYAYDDRIDNGEWSCALHVKTSGSATGSCAALVYDFDGGYGDQDVLVVAWDTPFSGSNSAACFCANRAVTYSKMSWDDIHDRAANGNDNGHSDLGLLRVRYTIGQNSSPILRVIASRKEFF